VTDHTFDYASQRPLMFAVAYRMTGSVVEAEDIAQDAYLRIMRSEAVAVNADAYVTTVTTRLAIDHLRSARVRREQYVGHWLPEPRLGHSLADPAEVVDQHETVSIAFLAVLERLSPSERAAFVLREAFDYSYEQIADVIGKTPDNCRQLVTRARARIGTDAPRFEASPAVRDELTARFFAACRDGDLAGLERLLAQDVRFVGDGGGKAPALAHPVQGRLQVARFVLGLIRRAGKEGASLRPAMVNGQPGATVHTPDGALYSVLSLHIADGQVVGLYNMLNPDKLLHLRQSQA
jgi:RNA polymerase sigma-70 factor (TIGR02957 family)